MSPILFPAFSAAWAYRGARGEEEKGPKEGAKIIIIFKMKTRLNGKAGNLVLCLLCFQCHSRRWVLHTRTNVGVAKTTIQVRKSLCIFENLTQGRLNAVPTHIHSNTYVNEAACACVSIPYICMYTKILRQSWFYTCCVSNTVPSV